MLSPPVTLARHSMATRFEIVLHGENPAALRATGEEALDEVERLEAQLSLYRPGSEIAQLNAQAARQAVRVTPELFELLEQAQRLHAESGGAFDITVAPLVRCWGFMGGQWLAASGRSDWSDWSDRSDESDGSGKGWRPPTKAPSAAAVAAARATVGMHQVLLDPANHTVRFTRDGVMLDLGAIGQGYAVERAAGILRDGGVTSALIHGGTSTICAIGHPPDAEFWRIAVDVAAELERRSPTRRVGEKARQCAGSECSAPAAFTFSLKDESLSVSAASGRQFKSGGRFFGHVIDPRTGQPTESALLAAVVLAAATETDALSTARLTLGRAGLYRMASRRPDLRALVVSREAGKVNIARHGFVEDGGT